MTNDKEDREVDGGGGSGSVKLRKIGILRVCKFCQEVGE